MSFKGRIKKETIGKPESSNITKETTDADRTIFQVFSIDGVNLSKGSKINIRYSVYGANSFACYHIGNDGLPIGTNIFVNDTENNVSDISFELTSDGAVGFSFYALQPAYYHISYTVQMLSTLEETLIDDPVSIIEHVKRLQNWSETGSLYNWGMEYSPDAKIRQSGEGSFLSNNLQEVRNIKIARQILDYDKAWSDAIVQSLCEQFYLVSYQNESGNECLKDILIKENPDTIIGFEHMMGNVGDMIEPQTSNIFCTPVINYAYDYATERYTRQIRVEQVWQSTWKSEYTPGLNSEDGSDIWTACSKLYKKVRQIEPIPSNLSDRVWIYRYQDAVWSLKRMIQLMEIRRCSFNVAYEVGRKWNIGKHLILQLPHETAGKQVEIVIEEIRKNKKNNRVYVKVMLLDDIETSFYIGSSSRILQDTTNINTLRQYQDIYLKYSERGTGDSDKQDTYNRGL